MPTMPSAVSSKVADILSRYSRPHSAVSVRTSSSSSPARPSTTPKPQRSHNQSPHPSSSSSHSHLHPPSSSSPHPRPSPPGDDWEDEMMDEFGADGGGSAPLHRLPTASSHTRSISAPAVKRGVGAGRGGGRGLVVRVPVEEEEEEEEVEFEEEELLIADSPVVKRTLAAPTTPARGVRPQMKVQVELRGDSGTVDMKPPSARSTPMASPAAKRPTVEVEAEDEVEEEYEDDSHPAPSVAQAVAAVSRVVVEAADEYEEDFEEVKAAAPARPLPVAAPSKVDVAEAVAEPAKRAEAIKVEVPHSPVAAVPQVVHNAALVRPAMLPSTPKLREAEKKGVEEPIVVARSPTPSPSPRQALPMTIMATPTAITQARPAPILIPAQPKVMVTSTSTQTEEPEPAVTTQPSPSAQPPQPSPPPQLAPVQQNQPPVPMTSPAQYHAYPPAAPYPLTFYYPQAACPYPYLAAPPPAFAYPPPPSHYYPHSPPYPATYPYPYLAQYPSFPTPPSWPAPSPSSFLSFALPQQPAPAPLQPLDSRYSPALPPPLFLAPPVHHTTSLSSSSSLSSSASPAPPVGPSAADRVRSPFPMPLHAWPETPKPVEESKEALPHPSLITTHQTQPTATPSPIPPFSSIFQQPSHSIFHSGPTSLSHFVSTSPLSSLTSSLTPPRPTACRECNPLPSPPPLYFSASSTAAPSLLPPRTRGYSSIPSSLPVCADTLYPVSAGLSSTDANAAFRHQLAALRATLSSYRTALHLTGS